MNPYLNTNTKVTVIIVDCLTFDNTFSWLRQKRLKYRVNLEELPGPTKSLNRFDNSTMCMACLIKIIKFLSMHVSVLHEMLSIFYISKTCPNENA